MVVVAPVLRFKDVGINANVNIKDLNTPDNLIAGALWQRQPDTTGAGVCEKDVRRCTRTKDLAAAENLVAGACHICAGAKQKCVLMRTSSVRRGTFQPNLQLIDLHSAAPRNLVHPCTVTA